MNNYLQQHPQIFMPERKEFHYFGSDIKTRHARITKQHYLSQFAPALHEKRVGEASVWYLYSQNAAKEIYDFCPSANIIAMLRNPVDMLYSQHSEFLFNGNEDITDFETAMKAEADRKQGRRIPESAFYIASLYYRETVDYAKQIKRYFNVFGRENVHVIIFDEFESNTNSVYTETLKFLEVDPDFQPTIRILNQNKVRRRLPGIISNNATRIVPQRHRHRVQWIVKARFKSREPMNPDTRKILQQEFKPKVNQLSKLLDYDLSHWSNN